MAEASPLSAFQPFYDGLVDVQQHFLSELCLRSLTHKIRGEREQTIRADFLKLSLQMKSYFTGQWLLSRPADKLRPDTRFYEAFSADSKTLALSDLPPAYRNRNKAEFQTLEIDNGALKRYLESVDGTNPAELAWIAYSLLPSFFHFYLLESRYGLMWDTLITDTIAPKTQAAIASGFFVTPVFLNFVRETVFAPFQKLRSAPANVKADDAAATFVREVEENWRVNEGLCPSLVVQYLNRLPDQDAALANLFWAPFLADPRRFLGSQYSDGPTSSKEPPILLAERLAALERALAAAHLGQLLGAISAPQPGISDGEESASPLSFFVQLLSDVDLLGLKHVSLRAADARAKFKDALPRLYRVFLIHFMDQQPCVSRECTETQTKVPGDAGQLIQAGFAIRDLLKAAPVLTPGLKLRADIEDERAILREFLVDPTDLRYARRIAPLLAAVTSTLDPPHGAPVQFPRGPALAAFFEQIKVRHTRGSSQHCLTVRVCRSLERLRYISDPALTAIPRLLQYKRLALLDRSVTSVVEAIGSQVSLSLILTSFHDGEKALHLRDPKVPPLAAPTAALHFLTRSVDFIRFRVLCDHLAVVDAALADYLRTPGARGSPSTPVGKWLAAHLSYLDPVAGALVAAYEENCDPLWKAIGIRRALDRVLWTVAVHFGDVSRDDETIIELARLAYAYIDPPHLASAFSFSTEFLGGSPRAWAYFGGPELRSLCALQQRLLQEWFAQSLTGFGLWTLSRDLQRQSCLAFHHDGGGIENPAASFFALLTNLSQQEMKGILGLKVDSTQWATPVAVIPDPPGRLGASVLSLCDITDANNAEAAFSDESRKRLKVAVWSQWLPDIGLFTRFGRIADFFALTNAPNVRILLCYSGGLTTADAEKKIAHFKGLIREAPPKTGWYGVELIEYANDDQTRDEVISVLREGLGQGEGNA